MTKLTNIKDNIPIYVEQKFIQTDLQASDILKTRTLIPSKFIKLERAEKKDKEQTDKYEKYRKELEQIDANNLVVKDYKKIKELQEKVNNLLKEKIESELLKTSIDTFLKKPLEELEKEVPKKVKLRVKGKSKGCSHKNIE